MSDRPRTDDGESIGAGNGDGRDESDGWAPRCGPLVELAELTRPYERAPDDPLTRPLRIFALDPAAPARDGREATIHVPYEPLEAGPKGAVLEVVPPRGTSPLDLNATALAIGQGCQPSPANPAFRQQMVYAVAMGVYGEFRAALGRDVGWGYRQVRAGDGRRLRLVVDGMESRNAEYDSGRGEIVFGYFTAVDRPPGALNLSGGKVHTALSHDIITHEVTHALLDGLRPHFMIATSPDALAFHEALADLIALFRKFSFETVVRNALAATRGRLDADTALSAIARQFGQTTGREGPLRSALQHGLSYRMASEEPHERCQVLVAAIWRAFVTVFERKVRPYILMATAGSGVLPDGDLPAYLHEMLARTASRIAQQFLRMIIRAIDYCPPVDLEFGEFLRALITADHALVPDDSWGYREALVEGFRALDIEPRGVEYLSEDVLLWRPPRLPPVPVPQLDFASLKFEGDPGRPVPADRLRAQAVALWQYVTHPERCAEFGLTRQSAPGESIDVPQIDFIRTTRRIGPHDQVVFDLVAQVTQRRIVRFDRITVEFTGGATVIIDPFGKVRYAIGKGITNARRLKEQFAFAQSAVGSRFWQGEGGTLRPCLSFHRKLHEYPD